MQLSVSGYNIEFGDAAEKLAKFLEDKDYSTISVLVDNNTQLHCLNRIKDAISPHNVITITEGEQHKNIETTKKIWSSLLIAGADRHSLLINLGGGVIGDMGGFAAATYMRGIDFIQMPTTLLSQVDASVGGKLGIDFSGLKNLVGLFHNPQIVIIDSNFLNTLPLEELKSGYAEMIKHALIKDKYMWSDYIANNIWKDNLSNKHLRDSVNIKRNVVIEDPYEKGLRKILNFGHTLGHAIETHSFNTDHPLLHGYAIALGMIGESYISNKVQGISTLELEQIKKYILSIYKIDTIHYQDIESILSHMKHDKKNKAGDIMISLLQTIGDCTYDIKIDEGLIRESLEYTLNA
ncbi:MAG: 3-dehydroquinate synthase [Saprospiraceae bacterium]